MKAEYNNFNETFYFTMDEGEPVNLSINEFWNIVEFGKKLNIRNDLERVIEDAGSIYTLASDTILQDETLMKDIIDDLYENYTELTDYVSDSQVIEATRENVLKKLEKKPELREQVNERLLDWMCAEFKMQLTKKEDGSVETYIPMYGTDKYRNVQDALIDNEDILRNDHLYEEANYVKFLRELEIKENRKEVSLETEEVAKEQDKPELEM